MKFIVFLSAVFIAFSSQALELKSKSIKDGGVLTSRIS